MISSDNPVSYRFPLLAYSAPLIFSSASKIWCECCCNSICILSCNYMLINMSFLTMNSLKADCFYFNYLIQEVGMWTCGLQIPWCSVEGGRGPGAGVPGGWLWILLGKQEVEPRTSGRSGKRKPLSPAPGLKADFYLPSFSIQGSRNHTNRS